MGNGELREFLEKLLADREEHAAEITKLDNAIEAIRARLGEAILPTTIPDTLAAIAERQRPEFQRAGTQPTIRPDQFFGKSQTEAADAYLRMIGHAAHTKQILEAISRGGVPVGGADPQTTLYKALVRGTRRFVLVSPQTFGLIDFYPNRVKKEKKAAPKRRPKKRVEPKQGRLESQG